MGEVRGWYPGGNQRKELYRYSELLPQTGELVGIDVGLKTFAYLSDGTIIANPRFFRQEEHNLAKAQRKRDTAPKQSKARRKLNKRVARVHERIRHRRQNFIFT